MTNYFQSYKQYFWSWEDQGQVIAIPGSYTISYKAFIRELLFLLQEDGFPSFGSLLLAIAATNINGQAQVDEIFQLKFSNGESIFANVHHEELGECKDFLIRLTQLPNEVKSGETRKKLIQTIFQKAHNAVSIRNSKTLYTSFEKLSDAFLYPIEGGIKRQSYHDIRTLTLISRRFPDNDALLKALKEIPELTEELVLETNQQVPDQTDYIDQLINNHKTFHSAALIKHLWGGLHIPFHSQHRGDQPIGGISDISNKGTFDRLLLSEFAYDDLTLMNRLANNEALYVKREVPPENNQFERFILIDTSLKSWGTPKTVAFAIALALAFHPKNEMLCRIIVLGQRAEEINYHSIAGLTEAFAQLHPGLDASQGLEHFFTEYTPSKDKEVILITNKDAFLRPNMLRAMHTNEKVIRFLIQTDEGGKIDVYQRQSGSRRHMQSLQPDLEILWSNQPKKTATRQPIPRSEKPTYPLLVPSGPIRTWIVNEKGEMFVHTRDRRILRHFVGNHFSSVKGWEVLCNDFPLPMVSTIQSRNEFDETLIMSFRHGNRKIYLLNTKTQKLEIIDFPDWSPVQPDFHPSEVGFRYILFKSIWHIGEGNTVRKSALAETEIPLPKPEDQIQINKNLKLQSISMRPNHVGITKNGELHINYHPLLNPNSSNNQLFFQTKKNTETVLYSTKLVKNKAYFPNGSTVESVTSFLLLFRSSNPEIPPFYICSVMGETAAATETIFSGSEAFFRESMPYVRLIVSNSSYQSQSLINSIFGYSSLSFNNNRQGFTKGYVNRKHLAQLKDSAKEHSLEIDEVHEMELIHDNQLLPMTPTNFYEKFIRPFIDHEKTYNGN